MDGPRRNESSSAPHRRPRAAADLGLRRAGMRVAGVAFIALSALAPARGRALAGPPDTPPQPRPAQPSAADRQPSTTSDPAADASSPEPPAPKPDRRGAHHPRTHHPRASASGHAPGTVERANEAPAIDPDRRSLKIFAESIDDDAIELDGVVDEAAWAHIAPLPAMIQRSPRWGAPASRNTEVRVAYGRRGVWASFVCHDRPEWVVAPFFIRDQLGSSDWVALELDPSNDDTNGFYFLLTPSGAVVDAQINRDVGEERLWDGVWRFAAKKTARGWEAEMFIPWATLRFKAAPQHEMGINVRRYVNREGETTWLSQPPLGVPGRLSYAARWVGLRDIHPGLSVELRPYASGRFALQRPSASLDDSWRALPNAGFDAKFGLTGTLTMDVAANPDFGQAEVDAAVLNLGPFEVFFPEKRTFFLESKELFETDFELFYTRRIGAAPSPGRAQLGTRTIGGQEVPSTLQSIDAQTRILGSARITGKIGKHWSIGALTASTGPTFGVESWQDGTTQRVPVDPLSQWSVVRLRRNFDGQSWVGGIVTNVLRPGPGHDTATGGVDYAQTVRKSIRHRGQVIGTWDGVRSGTGASVGLSHSSRRTFADISGRTLSPHANYNDLGFMLFPDFLEMMVNARVFNAQPVQRVRRMELGFHTHGRMNYAGLPTRKLGNFDAGLQTMGQWGINANFGGHLPEYDPYETRGGIPWVVPFHWWGGIDVWSPPQRRVTGRVGTSYGEQAGKPGPDLRLGLGLRPIDRLQFDLGTTINHSYMRPRWVATDDEGTPIFGRGVIWRFELNLRGTLAITPRLALTTFNQLLYNTAHHRSFEALLRPDLLATIDSGPWQGMVDQALASLISNSIVRWEYLPGAFLFLAYTHRSSLFERGAPDGFRTLNAFTNLGAPLAQHEDTLFLKLVHLFSL